MEKRIASLFDYQKFEGSTMLNALIAETENRLSMLDEDAISMVAGGSWNGKNRQIDTEPSAIGRC